MINLLSLVLFVIVLCGVKFYKANEYNQEYMSPQKSINVRGMVAYIVILHHLAINMCKRGDLFYQCYAYIGILCVSVFFFYSGYGLVLSFRKNKNYLDGFLKKRYLVIFIPYLIVAAMYWGWSALMDNPYSALYMLYSYISGFPFVENSWYVIVITLYYLVFWILAKLDKTSNQAIILVGTIMFAIAWMVFCLWRGWGIWWYISTLALATGVIWAIYGEILCRLIQRCYYLLFGLLIASWIMIWSWYIMQSGRASGLLATALFPLLLVFVSLKISIGNRVLGVLGRYSYEIYLTHGFFVKIFRGGDLYIKNDIWFVILVLIFTLLFSVLIGNMKTILLKLGDRTSRKG